MTAQIINKDALKDQEDIELTLWRNNQTTQKIFRQIKNIQINLLKISATQVNSEDKIIRYHLSRAIALEQLINKLEKGDMNEINL